MSPTEPANSSNHACTSALTTLLHCGTSISYFLPSGRYYNSWHQCKYDHSDEEPQCARLKGWAYSMCPYEWVEKWEQQRDAGTYPGPVPGEKKDD